MRTREGKRAKDKSKTIIKKRTCPKCGNKKAGIKYGYMACLKCGYLYPSIEKGIQE